MPNDVHTSPQTPAECRNCLAPALHHPVTEYCRRRLMQFAN